MQLGKNALITLTSSQYFLLIEKLEENGRNIKKNYWQKAKNCPIWKDGRTNLFTMSTEVSWVKTDQNSPQHPSEIYPWWFYCKSKISNQT